MALLLPTQQAELLACQTVWQRSQHGGEERFQAINKPSPTWPAEGGQFIPVKPHCGQDSQSLGRAANQGWATWLDSVSRKTQSHSLPCACASAANTSVCLSVCPPPHSTAKAHPECRDKTSWIADLQPHQQQLAAQKALRGMCLLCWSFCPKSYKPARSCWVI